MSEQTQRIKKIIDNLSKTDYEDGPNCLKVHDFLELSTRLDNLEGWCAGIIQNEHKFIEKEPDVEFDPKTGKLANTLQEQINELRLMVEALTKNVKGLNRTEEMKWKDAYSRLIAGTFDNGRRLVATECSIKKASADNAKV